MIIAKKFFNIEMYIEYTVYVYIISSGDIKTMSYVSKI